MKSIFFNLTCRLITNIRASNPVVSTEVQNPIGNNIVILQNDKVGKQSNLNVDVYSKSFIKNINKQHNSKYNRFNRKRREICELSNDVLKEFLEPKCPINLNLVALIDSLKLKNDDSEYFDTVFFLLNLIFPKITNLSSKIMHEQYQINKEEFDRLFKILTLRSKIFEISNQIENQSRKINFFARHYDNLVENNQKELIEQYLELTNEKNENLNNLVFWTVKFKNVLCEQISKYESENKTPAY